MEKFFNTAGPVNKEDNYCLDPLKRINLSEIEQLIVQKKYFILHAPRQTGKTSSLLALQEYLNKQGKYKCLYVNFEAGQASRGDIASAMKSLLTAINMQNMITFKDDFFKQYLKDGIEIYGEGGVLGEALSSWSLNNEKKIIILIDEIDSLVGDTLISILRQIRAGYTNRPDFFPQSIILCGVRDVRDYRIYSDSEKQVITGGSAFNIKSESLTLGNFTKEEIKRLYEQHTTETGQDFEEGICDLVWEYTEGQPWLVNALAYQTCFRDEEGKNRENPITVEMMEKAKNTLIIRRDTHLDQLVDKLKEDRVKRIIEPMLQGIQLPNDVYNDDIEYCQDLGLIKRKSNGLNISNDIYREIIPRVLNNTTQIALESEIKRSWYIEKDGRLNMKKLLTNFQQFFREHSESWLERFQYREAGPQLLLQAFLQRITNGEGQIDREYGLGKKRTDLYIRWPIINESGEKTGIQRIVIELKLKYKNSLEKVIEEGLEQTSQYVDKTGAEEAHLIIFDQENRNWEEKIFVEIRETTSKYEKNDTVHEIEARSSFFHENLNQGSKKITIWGM